MTGAEVKSVRAGGLKLENSFVKILEDGAMLLNAEIPQYRFAKTDGYDLKRSRKLLLRKDELLRLKTKISSSSGLAIVPVSCYNKGSYIKLEIALAKGRKDVEKRKLEKERDVKREQEREAREWG